MNQLTLHMTTIVEKPILDYRDHMTDLRSFLREPIQTFGWVLLSATIGIRSLSGTGIRVS